MSKNLVYCATGFLSLCTIELLSHLGILLDAKELTMVKVNMSPLMGLLIGWHCARATWHRSDVSVGILWVLFGACHMYQIHHSPLAMLSFVVTFAFAMFLQAFTHHNNARLATT